MNKSMNIQRKCDLDNPPLQKKKKKRKKEGEQSDGHRHWRGSFLCKTSGELKIIIEHNPQQY